MVDMQASGATAVPAYRPRFPRDLLSNGQRFCHPRATCSFSGQGGAGKEDEEEEEERAEQCFAIFLILPIRPIFPP